MVKTKELLTKAQARYKKNDDFRLLKQCEVIHLDDYVYLRVERKDPNEHRHKLPPIAKGPWKVIKVDDKTVVIEKTDRLKVSHLRILLAPEPKSKKEMESIFKPTKVKHKDTSYPTKKEVNMNDVANKAKEEDDEREHEEAADKELGK